MTLCVCVPCPNYPLPIACAIGKSNFQNKQTKRRNPSIVPLHYICIQTTSTFQSTHNHIPSTQHTFTVLQQFLIYKYNNVAFHRILLSLHKRNIIYYARQSNALRLGIVQHHHHHSSRIRHTTLAYLHR